MLKSSREQNFVIFATTLGGIIEWYELFLYVYWAPIISKLFFKSDSDIDSLMKTLFVFFVGFLARPIGGLIFGHIGDKYGRKISFVKSIFMMTLPSFAMGIIPSHGMGVLAPIILCILRFFQGLPAGGELPGAMCYLAESALPGRKAYTCSYSFFGPQIGVMLSMGECLFLENHLSYESLVSWGWRLSFIIGGVLGIIGFYIRSKLNETPAFRILEEKNETSIKPITETIIKLKKNMTVGFVVSFLDVVGFYMFSVFLGIYFYGVLKINEKENLIITICSLAISTISLPFIGMIGDRYNVRSLLMMSALGMILFSLPFYISASHASLFFTTFFEFLLMLLLNIQFALLPSLLASLFPTSMRYTGIGLSFNLCDSVIGGATPFIALLLVTVIGDVKAFVFLITFASIITFFALRYMVDRNLKIN